MVPLSPFCISAFTWSASSGASIVHNINSYTEESPTKRIGGFVWNVSNRIPRGIGKKRRTPKIYNGREALVGEFPWMASIHWNNEGRQSHQCGGAIISQKHILTAAHCLPTTDEKITVLVGGHFQDESLEPRAQRIAVKKATNYTAFDSFSYKHDIAILVLEKEINLNDYTAIINLPSRKYLFGDVNAIAAGWGKTWGATPYQWVKENSKIDLTIAATTPANSDKLEVSPMLKATNLTIFNNTECTTKYFAYVDYTFESYTICAAASDQTGDFYPGDTTPGDSGGPLFLKENGKWVVVGITSLGHQTVTPLPGVYTRVSAYLSWIKVQMNTVETETLTKGF